MVKSWVTSTATGTSRPSWCVSASRKKPPPPQLQPLQAPPQQQVLQHVAKTISFKLGTMIGITLSPKIHTFLYFEKKNYVDLVGCPAPSSAHSGSHTSGGPPFLHGDKLT